MLYGIDPGTSESAILYWNGKRTQNANIIKNSELLSAIRGQNGDVFKGGTFAIEMIASYGMSVGAEVFATCVFIGELSEALRNKGAIPRLVFRRDVKLFWCGQARAKDANIIQAIKDRFGDRGTKAQPNPVTYPLKSHLWQAFALAVYAAENPA